jgi:oxygen-dependent protoporphyrinogen oxidase
MNATVIGGGISGLTCAYFLKQGGANVRLLESSPRLGGAIQTVRQEGFLFELGPQSFLSTDLLRKLITDLGLEDELLVGNPRAPRFILHGGKLVAAPLAPPSLLGTSLFGAGTKFRLFTEIFRRTRPPEVDESVAAFVRRKFGADLLDNLVGPLISGIYAGDPEYLSLRAAFPFVHQWEAQYGSVIRGAMKSRPPRNAPGHGLSSFREGVSALPAALAQSLGDSVETSATVRSIRRRTAGGFELDVEARSGTETLSTEVLILATPADVSGTLLAPLSGGAADCLHSIPYAAVAVVDHGFRRENVQHPLAGFGFLVPRKAQMHTLGTVWSSSLFPGRAEEGMISLASFVGGAMNHAAALASPDEIAAKVECEIRPILGLQGPPLVTRVAQYLRALPQYNLGHDEKLARLKQELARLPGIHLAGNYLSGPSIGACVTQARQTADAVLRLGGRG